MKAEHKLNQNEQPVPNGEERVSFSFLFDVTFVFYREEFCVTQSAQAPVKPHSQEFPRWAVLLETSSACQPAAPKTGSHKLSCLNPALRTGRERGKYNLQSPNYPQTECGANPCVGIAEAEHVQCPCSLTGSRGDAAVPVPKTWSWPCILQCHLSRILIFTGEKGVHQYLAWRLKSKIALISAEHRNLSWNFWALGVLMVLQQQQEVPAKARALHPTPSETPMGRGRWGGNMSWPLRQTAAPRIRNTAFISSTPCLYKDMAPLDHQAKPPFWCTHFSSKNQLYSSPQNHYLNACVINSLLSPHLTLYFLVNGTLDPFALLSLVWWTLTKTGSSLLQQRPCITLSQRKL